MDNRPPLNLWKDIERCWVERIDIVYEGHTIVGLHHTGYQDAIKEIDRLCSKLQEYKRELSFHYDGEITDKKSRFFTYIYLMKDNSTGYYKIGRSIRPQHREKTLLSQSPNIEMVFVSEVTDQKTEKVIHGIFNNKRIRGEWFDLEPSDIEVIKKFNYDIK